jgi:Transglycosylase SLT domain
MTKPITPKPPKSKETKASTTPKVRQVKKPVQKKPEPKPAIKWSYRLLLITIELLGLAMTAVFAIMMLLGYSASLFTGTSFFSSLLPFAIGVLALIVAMAGLLIGWYKSRKWLHRKHLLWPAIISFSLALGIGGYSMQEKFSPVHGHFRTLVGGKQEAGRITIAHQVYAAYRRYDAVQLQTMVQRGQDYNAVINEAATEFALDPALLQGVAATESSFLPRNSTDGGHGLFQITQVPKAVVEQAGKRLAEHQMSLHNHRHNAFLAAATLKYYLAEMKGDLFLGLLAYNIGPANGGLRFIMQQYGATDFVTIQPYLQSLPRDYPIRVLSYALAFRVWQKEGKLLPYEEGSNALHIQHIGIPGLQEDYLG